MATKIHVDDFKGGIPSNLLLANRLHEMGTYVNRL